MRENEPRSVRQRNVLFMQTKGEKEKVGEFITNRKLILK